MIDPAGNISEENENDDSETPGVSATLGKEAEEKDYEASFPSS